jgi:spore coat protein U-like protein
MKRFLLPLMCLFVLFLASGTASAADQLKCTFDKSGVLEFSMDPLLSRTSEQKMQIDADCSSYVFISVLGFFQQPVRVCMSLDAGTTGSSTTRSMIGPNGKKIGYQPAGGPNKASPYTVGTEVPNEMVLPFNFVRINEWVPSSSSFPIYGSILDTKGIEEGVYTDTVQAKFRYIPVGGFLFPGWFFPPGCSFTGGDTVTATMQVRVQVKPFCALDVSQHIDFGNWQDLDQPRDQQGAVTVNCDASTKYAVKLGWGGQGDVNKTRNMANGNEKISYNLYSDDKRLQPWGDNATTGFLKDQQGEGKRKVIPIYARVPRQATPSPGTYTDNVVVTLEYN